MSTDYTEADDHAGPSRRRVIKSLGTAGSVGGPAIALASQPASARRARVGSRGGDQERAWSIPRKERRRRMNMLPVGGKAVRKRWSGNMPTYDDSGMYAYVGSIHRGDICAWNAALCGVAATAGAAYKVALGTPANVAGAGVAALLGCLAPQATCGLLDAIGREGMDMNTEWLHIYTLAGPWWYRTWSTLPKWYAIAIVKD